VAYKEKPAAVAKAEIQVRFLISGFVRVGVLFINIAFINMFFRFPRSTPDLVYLNLTP
jgi:hypothetical protein